MAILSAFGESYVRDNKDAKYRLISHETRPSLTLIPPPSVDKRPMSFKFIDAVQRLVPNFTKDEWGKIYDKVGTRLHVGKLQKVFILLSDEDRLQAGSRSGPAASGSNTIPLAGGSSVRGRGGQGGRFSQGLDRSGLKRGHGSDPSATPAKSRRGK